MSEETRKTVQEPDFEKLANDRSASRFNRFVTIILLAICIVLAAFIIFRISTASSDSALAAPVADNAATAVNVSAEPAFIGDFSNITRLNGEVVRENGSEISVYPEITSTGTVTEILVGLGDEVKNGMTVAYIDASRPGASYKASPVTAKVDGIVTSVPVAVGQTVSASQPIITVSGSSELVVNASIPEKFLGTVAEGMTAEMEAVAYPGRIYTGTLSYIAPTVNTADRSSAIEIEFTGDTTGIKQGMYLKLNLETEFIGSVLMVPTSAMDTYLGEPVVYLADNGTARRQAVTTGSSNSQYTVITSGLSEGDLVITAGNITDGSAISVVNQEV